jgi:hypothetical protein
VPRQPKGKVDIEVIRTLICVSASQISERAMALVHCQNQALNQHDPGKDRRLEKPALQTSNGNRQDTSDEKGPDYRVEKLYRN